ncbi:MAG: TonB-dependent receptor [Deltaproteobacteria bacterium]|nr:MAG: TonB-dependent receptor [Deltaproteobacteria bacterium]
MRSLRGTRSHSWLRGASFLALLAAAVTTAAADEPASENRTGTRSETPLSASPVTTEVIGHKWLEESGVRTVSEALALRPGLWIDRGVAGTTGITIQGLGPRYSLILVDGARQIGRTDGYLDLDRFGIADIEQIEIVRGPSSALYGADALGGVVNIITRKPRDGIALDAVTRLDGRLAADTRARIAFGRDGLAGAVAGEYREGPAIRRRDPSAVATTLDSYVDRHVDARVTVQRGDRWQFDGAADYLYRDLRGIDASPTGDVFDRRNLVETASAHAAAQYTAQRSVLHISGAASLYRDQYLHDQRMSDTLDQHQITTENLVEGSSQLAGELGSHRPLVGAELLREALNSDRLSTPGSRVRGAVYAQDEWRIGQDDQLLAVATVRLDYDTQFGTHATPRLAGRWQVSSQLTLHGSIGMGYRAPDFKELLLHFENPSVGYVVDGNSHLRPETSRNVQGGAKWQATPWLWLSTNGFYNDLHDLINVITEPDDGSGTLQFGYGNVGRARTAGLESYATMTHGRAGLELGYALTRARDLDGERPLAGVPEHRFTATARWRDPAQGFDAFAAFVVTGHRPYYLSDDPQAATPSPQRLEIRARVAKRFRGGYGGFLGVDNLLNAGDANLDRIPPRTLYAGLEMHL